MSRLNITWRRAWTSAFLFAVSWFAMACGAAEPGVHAAPPSGGVAPSLLHTKSRVASGEWEEPEEVVDGGEIPPAQSVSAVPASELPRRLPGTNPVPDRGYRNVRATVYGADWCGLCDAAERLLRSKGVRVSVKNIEKDAGAREDALRKLERVGQTRISKIPVIDINGRILVGYSRRAIEKALDRARVRN